MPNDPLHKTTVGRITFGPAEPPRTSPELVRALASIAQYRPDPAEEAWHASPEGKRNAARLLRERAARDLAEAERLEGEAANG